MPEELRPCPACGADTIEAYSIKGTYQAACWNCHMRGPRKVEKSAAIAAWNSLHITPHITPNDVDCKGCPERRDRGLVWTKERPKVSGNYWWICGQEQPDEPQMVNVVLSEGRFHFFFHYSEGPFFHECDSCQWAGPIPMPQEHAK